MATLKDVARETGLTVSTVSRVLNNRGYISDDARKKVAEAMKKLNYRPNELARSLQNKKSNIIGVLVPHIQHPYFSEMISHLESAAYDRGYKVFLFNTRGREDMAREYVDMCNASRVEGIVLCSGNISDDIMDSLTVPMIALERPISNCAASVVCDNANGADLATNALIDAGCRNLLFIGNVLDVSMPADDRAKGFEEVCRSRGIQCSIVHTDLDVYRNLDYYHYVDTFLGAHPEVDGIFCSSDIIAAQVLQLCKAKGIRVPEDVKVVGFDDVNIASLTSPQLTTIHQPIEEMSKKAIDLLARAIDGEKDLENVTLPVTLVRRESV